ncbi:MAG: hypothetical protein ACLFO2_00805 [Candidatus Woesearchaeota archaeon]
MVGKAQASMGVIILFISALFVGAIAAGVFIQNSNSYQSSATQAGDQARKEVSTVFFVTDIVGTDGTDGDIEHLKQIIKLPPGTDPVSLDYLTLVLNTPTETATLDYRGPDGETANSNQGFNTWTPEEVGEIGDYHNQLGEVDGNPPVDTGIDLDYDGLPDTVVVCQTGFECGSRDGEYLKFSLSTGGDHYVRLVDPDGNGVDISSSGQDLGNLLTPIGDYGYVSITGTTTTTYTIPEGAMQVYQKPYVLEEDLDDDGLDDSLVINDTHVIVHYSHNGNISLQLNRTEGNAYPFGFDLSTGAQAIEADITLEEGDEEYGTIEIEGTTSRESYIDPEVQFLVTPKQLNKGYFVADYIQTTDETREGFLRQDDVIRLYYEAPAPIQEDEEVKILLTTRSGAMTRTEFYMPNIIRSESVNLYP